MFVFPRRPARFIGAALLAVAGLVAGSPRATAGSVDLQFDKTTGSAGVSFQYKSGTATAYTPETATPGPYYWHQVGTPLNSAFPNAVATFCVELNQTISTGNQYVFTSTALASQTGVTATEAADITKLWGAYYNTAWGSSTFTGSTQSTAFQLALWKLVYDQGNNLSLSSGNFVVTGSTVGSAAATLAQSWLNALATTSSTIFSTNFAGQQLVWLSNGTAQDQITMIPSTTPPAVSTPAPPGVVLAGIGLVGLVGRSARRRPAAG